MFRALVASRRFSTLLILATVMAMVPVQAEIVLAPIFQDRAVLQHGKPLPVWGTASPGTVINVSFAGQEKSTVADANGRWTALLSPVPPSFESAKLVVTGDNSTLTLTDIVVGEVWIASGQSNMEWPLRESRDHEIEIAAAHWPHIREIKIHHAVADEPLASAPNSGWRPASPSTVPGFSAIAYFFARDLHQILKVPVGIIHASRSGTRIEAWMTPESLSPEKGGHFAATHDAWGRVLKNYPAVNRQHRAALAAWETAKAEAEASGKKHTVARPPAPQGPGSAATPSGLYNAMIHPLAPAAIAGFLWYQGEGNVGAPDAYADFFPTLIKSWRERFAQGDVPFLWVQLAATHSGDPAGLDWPRLRDAQTSALSLPATGQAVTIDIGDAHSVHPFNKSDVGRRLARLALNRAYSRPTADTGPTFERAERQGNSLRIHFKNTGARLKAPSGEVSGFELAGEDRVFHPATAAIDGPTVTVSSPAVPTPVAVRYAWRNMPRPGLYNDTGLPAVPFRTDTW